MGKRQSPKLNKVEIPLDTSDNKLFPKPKKAKGNFGKTISKQPLTLRKHKRIVPSKGVKKKHTKQESLGRKNEVQKINNSLDKLPKVISVFGLAAFALAFFVDKYQADTTVLVLATALASIAVITIFRK